MSSRVNPQEINIIPYEDPRDPKASQDNDGVTTSRVKSSGHKPLEFVTVTSAKQKRNKEISTVVRTQVMRDYFWKRKNPDSTDQAASDNPTNPSQYKGRFRLNSQPAKTKPSTSARKAKGREKTSNEVAREQKGRIMMPKGPVSDPSIYDPDGFFASTPAGLLGGSLDPFDSFSLRLKPETLKLIYYYKQSYSKDFLDLNIGGGYCLFDARKHRALFHSILYLVALDYNLRRGFSDTFGCLYHSSEAFRLINEQIRNGMIGEATIAAVALIAAKENLSGMFDVSYMHMQGLKYMVHKKGGIENIKGLHRGVVIWADFCNSSVWNCPPQFPHTSITSKYDIEFPSKESPTNNLSQDDLDIETRVVSLVQSLREISAAKDVKGHRKTEASRVYDIEYRLHLLKADIPDCGSISTEQEWFAESLKSLYAKSSFRDMDQLQETLKTVLWQDSWGEYYFKKLREEIA
ncbi:hypothetical protein TrVFT333_002194 [Trichoderma virens FT-333]|nr:hypothetical protein TrVFT333_002194 [Trichoderma virens FT-333]